MKEKIEYLSREFVDNLLREGDKTGATDRIKEYREILAKKNYGIIHRKDSIILQGLDGYTDMDMIEELKKLDVSKFEMDIEKDNGRGILELEGQRFLFFIDYMDQATLEAKIKSNFYSLTITSLDRILYKPQ